jgi:hypothetical protein
MGSRASPPPPPPKWQQVIAPKAREEGEAPEPPSVVVDVPEDRLDDARELAPSFARLPDHAKAELRDLWRRQEGVHGEQRERRKETSHRWAAEGAGLLLVSVALLMMPTRLELLLAGVLGAALGYAASRLKPSPLMCGFVFAAAYVAFGGCTGFRNFAYGILSIPIVLCLAAALATTHRIQRFDSTEL